LEVRAACKVTEHCQVDVLTAGDYSGLFMEVYLVTLGLNVG